MIASIFSKSKPINFLIVFLLTLLIFVLTKINYANYSLTGLYALKQTLIFTVCYFTILVLNFIVSRNQLTQKGNFEILLYSLFLASIPQTLLNTNIIVANFFILLALRRIISLRSSTQVKKKLLDAAIWIGIASLFYFWAIMFFILILASLIAYTENEIKHWIIPFVGILIVFICCISYSLLLDKSVFESFDFPQSINLDFSNYNATKYVLAITILFSFAIWASIFYLKDLKKKAKKLRMSHIIVFVALLISFSIIILSEKKSGSEFLFLFAPLAIILANYIETIKDKWFKEIFIIVLVILPITVLML